MPESIPLSRREPLAAMFPSARRLRFFKLHPGASLTECAPPSPVPHSPCFFWPKNTTAIVLNAPRHPNRLHLSHFSALVVAGCGIAVDNPPRLSRRVTMCYIHRPRLLLALGADS